jgi:hypothetical protein
MTTTETATSVVTAEDIRLAQIRAWNLCVFSMHQEGVIDRDQTAAAVKACPYLPGASA